MKSEHLRWLTDEEKKQYDAAEKSGKKVKAMQAIIVEKCRQQGFTLREFQCLIQQLSLVVAKKHDELTRREFF